MSALFTGFEISKLLYSLMFVMSSFLSVRLDGPLKPDFCFFVHLADGSYKWKCEERGQCLKFTFYIHQTFVTSLIEYNTGILRCVFFFVNCFVTSLPLQQCVSLVSFLWSDIECLPVHFTSFFLTSHKV